MKEKIKNPLPMLWQYKHDDRSTWPYLTCNVREKRNNEYEVIWLRNPYFDYSHLVKGL